MGVYVNPPATMMEMDRRSPVYVDKSGLLDFANSVLGTSERYICVPRPRRFGKTMAANMLLAYYRRVGDSATQEVFVPNLEIAAELSRSFSLRPSYCC